MGGSASSKNIKNKIKSVVVKTPIKLNSTKSRIKNNNLGLYSTFQLEIMHSGIIAAVRSTKNKDIPSIAKIILRLIGLK